MSTEVTHVGSTVAETGGSTQAGLLAPRADWGEVGASEHFVQFYEADAFLLETLVDFVGAALGAGEAAVVVATREHREGLETLLREKGLGVAAAACGQLVLLDAAETFAKFMVGGSPDAGLFAGLIGSLIARASEGRPRVRVYGEMVTLLWAEGNYDAALRLEGLWNDLRHSHTFALFCAYPMCGLAGEEQGRGRAEVCTSHTRVIPAESYTALAGADERLREITLLQQKARSLEAEVAERRRAEERVRAALLNEQAARAEAESATRLKDEFLATVSHELRTPLNAILGWAAILRTGQFDRKSVERALETIERNARAQAQIIEDLLDVSRIITGRLHLDRQPVDSRALVGAAIDSIRPAAEAKGIRIDSRLDHVSPLVCDPARLQQVLWNLLSNAVKFTPAGGEVLVTLRRADSCFLISVSDTGQGIGLGSTLTVELPA